MESVHVYALLPESLIGQYDGRSCVCSHDLHLHGHGVPLLDVLLNNDLIWLHSVIILGFQYLSGNKGMLPTLAPVPERWSPV
jgi:hypothetical protein